MSALVVHDISKVYTNQLLREQYRILSGVSLDVGEGEICALLGPSGCGKSTLLRIIVGTELADSGTVSFHPCCLNDVGLVFQHENCLPWLRVGENVEFGLRVASMSKKRREEVADEALTKVGLRGMKTRYPGRLSGGEQQRVAFARLLASGKGVWLLDEPFSALDARSRGDMRALLRESAQGRKAATLLVTHDVFEAVSLAHRIFVMSDAPSFICCRIERVGDLRMEATLLAEAQRFISEVVGARETIPPAHSLEDYVVTMSLARVETATPLTGER